MTRIVLDDVSFRYPGAAEDTVRSLALDIPSGEAHALLGASGAGKTTLLNLLSGLLQPTGGAIRFDDVDVSALRGRERAVAQVFQFPVLYEGMTVADNLAFPLRARGSSAQDTRDRVDLIAQELELGPLLERKPASLSLFEKQLVAVGKALVRPDLSMVLLDEPLTAVEPRAKWRLRQALRRAQDDLGVTMIYVTHDQTEALTFADRVSLLYDGQIVQTGTPEALYDSPTSEFVGHFVGSPGMNFLPAAAVGVTSGERIGFRPEWASIVQDSGLAGALRGTRPLGTQDGVATGLTTVATEHGEVTVRGALPETSGTSVRVSVQRCVVFSGGLQTGIIAELNP